MQGNVAHTRPGPMGRLTMVVIIVSALLAVLFVGTLTEAAPFDDVPAGHWTYGALEQLSGLELIDGYPPGFFSGMRRLTRYEMALSLAGALDRLHAKQEGAVEDSSSTTWTELLSAYNRSNGRKPLSAAEAELLQATMDEFTPELQMLGYRTPSNEGDGATGTKERRVLDASLDDVARHVLQRGQSTSNMWSTGPSEANIRPSGGMTSSFGPTASRGSEGISEQKALARIGSTVLFVPPVVSADENDNRPSSPSLDSTIQLARPADAPIGGAGADGLGPWQVTETRTGTDDVPLSTNVSLSGQRTQRTSARGDATATEVEAKVLLGDVSIDGKLRSVEPEFASRFAREGDTVGDAIGLGLTVRLGDVLLSTGQDVVQRAMDSDPEVVKSLTLKYGFTDTATVQAGWQSVSDARERTSVDVNVPVPQGALHFGLAYEGGRDDEGVAISMTTLTMAGLDLRLRDNAEARAAFSVRDLGLTSERTTSLGLRYTLSSEAAVLLGYQFIDFAEENDAENVTTAEFSIRF